MVIRARAALTWSWPFLLWLAVMANLAVLPVLVVQMADAIEQAERASAANAVLIERSSPCLPGDRPDSEACLAMAERDRLVAEALAGVLAQHEHQTALVEDAIGRLAVLEARPAATVPAPAPAPRATTGAAPTTQPAAATTTTDLPGRSDDRKAKK